MDWLFNNPYRGSFLSPFLWTIAATLPYTSTLLSECLMGTKRCAQHGSTQNLGEEAVTQAGSLHVWEKCAEQLFTHTTCCIGTGGSQQEDFASQVLWCKLEETF